MAVELLWSLSRPDRSSLNGFKDCSFVGDDLVHDDVVKDTADKSSQDLCGKQVARGKLDVLCKLKILHQGVSLSIGVVSIQREVHVGHWVSGMEVTANHLNDSLRLGSSKSEKGNKTTLDGGEEPGKNDGDEERPPWQTTLDVVKADKCSDNCTNKESHEPP